MTDRNNREYEEFDKIACCSESVKKRFLEGSCISSDKVYTLRNFYDTDVCDLADVSPYQYDDGYINIVSVSRLSPEKGIDRAIEALYRSQRNDIRYYVVGDGPHKNILTDLVKKYQLNGHVFFVGEKQNPYGYMAGADALLVPSLHEAAPMVFDEARAVGLYVITTDTTSAAEMIGSDFGTVCENSTEGIAKAISEFKKREAKNPVASAENIMQREQLEALIK